MNLHGKTALVTGSTSGMLAGITGSASGGMSIALAAMSETFVAAPTPPIFRSRYCTVSPPWPAAAWTPCRTTGR